MGRRGVTKAQAEKVLKQVRMAFAEYLGDEPYGTPTLRDHNHECLDSGCWSIDWEEGPFEWAIRFPHGGLDWETYQGLLDAGAPEEVAKLRATTLAVEVPSRVFVEPINTYTLGLYPA